MLQAKDRNDMAMKEILIQNGFPLQFPKKVLDEADALKETIDDNRTGKKKRLPRYTHFYD